MLVLNNISRQNHGVGPAVEDVAENRQREVTQLLRLGIIPQQRQRQKEEDEKAGGENHRLLPELNVFDCDKGARLPFDFHSYFFCPSGKFVCQIKKA